MRLKTGDIFSINVTGNEVGFGQIIYKEKYKFIVVVFPELFKKAESYDLGKIVSSVPLLMGFTLDALLYHGEWKIVGNYKGNAGKYPFPFYKLGIPPEVFLVDYRGNKMGIASEKEVEVLSYQSTLAPIYYEEALKAYHKLVLWENSFNEILYQDLQEQIKIVLATNGRDESAIASGIQE